MKHFTRFQSVSAVLVLALIVCAAACLPSGSSAPRTPPPAAAPSAPAAAVQDSAKPPVVQPAGKVIFQDNFKDINSGWRVFANDYGEGKYENGSYSLKSVQPAYPRYDAYTSNAGIPPLVSFMLDMDVTMLSGGRDDQFGILLKWPDIDPTGVVGYEQPSDYYFVLTPAGMSVWAYTKQEIKGSSADKAPGYFLPRRNYTSVKGINSVNNIKIWFNPNVRFVLNDFELVDTPDENIAYVNRLVKDKAMAGAGLQIFANSQSVYSSPVFQLNRIAVYANN
jgi:hypothetical protein